MVNRYFAGNLLIKQRQGYDLYTFLHGVREYLIHLPPYFIGDGYDNYRHILLGNDIQELSTGPEDRKFDWILKFFSTIRLFDGD